MITCYLITQNKLFDAEIYGLCTLRRGKDGFMRVKQHEISRQRFSELTKELKPTYQNNQGKIYDVGGFREKIKKWQQARYNKEIKRCPNKENGLCHYGGKYTYSECNGRCNWMADIARKCMVKI
jgi:hypothetical protein